MTAALAPFVAALGEQLERASPAVRRHLAMAERTSLHEGILRRLWRRGWAGRIAARVLHLDGDAGSAFELRNEIVADRSGEVAMLWRRDHASARGLGSIRFDPARRVLVDSIGARGRLEVELDPSVEDRAVILRSRRQWIRWLGIRWRLPRLLFGGAEAREWENSEGGIGLELTLRHPLFGPLAGYEAVMREVHPR
jgi:Domain of unknown function (DUF4166)